MRTVVAAFNDLSIRSWVAALSLVSLVVGRFKTLNARMANPALPASARAVTLLEYAIMGGIAVIVGLIFRTQLQNFINNMWTRINSFFG